jgi:alkylation response protein AidB-like acyl-CoA dehydrogenase
MHFGFTQEQDILRQEARKFLDEQCPLEEVRRIAETTVGYSADLWQQLGELGWLGLTIPEAYGGAGLSWVDLVVLLEETGRSLFPSPLISTTLAARAVLEAGTDRHRQRCLPGLADGSRIGTLALLEDGDYLTPARIHLRGEPDGEGFVLDGTKHFVADVAQADLLLVVFRTGPEEHDLTLALIDGEARGVSAKSRPSLDETKRVGSLELDGVRVTQEDILGDVSQAWPVISRLLDRGAVAVTAESIGAAEAALHLTVQFAKDRVQFGSPIGRFQGVKHPLAEMYVDIESVKSLLYFSAWALDESPDEAPRSVSLAKAYACDAFTRVGIDCIQLHGAVGYTLEYDVQLYLKRSKWARQMFGDADYHYDRVASLGGF